MSQSRQKRPWLAALLQLLCLTGGLGYLYLGQHRRGVKLLVLMWVLQAAVAGGSSAGVYVIGMILGPIIFTLQACSALDAWLLAGASADGPLEPRQAGVKAMAWL